MEYSLEQYETQAAEGQTLSGKVLFEVMSFVNDFKLGTEMHWGRKCGWTTPYAEALVFSDLDTQKNPFSATDVAENLITYIDQASRSSRIKITGILPPALKVEESASYNLRSASAVTNVMINSFLELQKDPDYCGKINSIDSWKAVFEAIKERQEQ